MKHEHTVSTKPSERAQITNTDWEDSKAFWKDVSTEDLLRMVRSKALYKDFASSGNQADRWWIVRHLMDRVGGDGSKLVKQYPQFFGKVVKKGLRVKAKGNKAKGKVPKRPEGPELFPGEKDQYKQMQKAGGGKPTEEEMQKMFAPKADYKKFQAWMREQGKSKEG